MEGGIWPGSLGKSRGASERDGDELEWPGDGHSERMVVEGAHGYRLRGADHPLLLLPL